MTTQRCGGHGGRFSAIVVAGLSLLFSVSLVACRQNTGRLTGHMFIPPGMRGTAQWGDVWLVRNYGNLRAVLGDRQRLLILSLLGKDAEFMRTERKRLLQLAAIRAKLQALNRGEIPTRVVMPPRRAITALTPMDSVIAGVWVRSRPATAPELATEIDVQKQSLKAAMRAMRDAMEPSVKALRAQRSNEKRGLLAGADAAAAQAKITSSPVGMDGRYFFDNIPTGDFGLYSRYRLLGWFVLTPVTVNSGVVVKDIPRLPGAILNSKAIIRLDALCAEIARL